MKKIIILFVVCFLLFNSAVAFADFDDHVYIVGDLAFARPVGLAATIIGGAIFIVSLPFSLPSGSVKNTADTLVVEPFRFTFKRPLGDFGHVSYAPEDQSEQQQKGDDR
jgi:hypothetical protein